MALIEECIDSLALFDMAVDYWQIEGDPRDNHKIAFLTKYDLCGCGYATHQPHTNG